MALLFSGVEPLVQFLKENIMRNVHVNLNGIETSGLGYVVKNISNLELWWPISSAERNHMCNCDRGYKE